MKMDFLKCVEINNFESSRRLAKQIKVLEFEQVKIRAAIKKAKGKFFRANRNPDITSPTHVASDTVWIR